MKLKDFIRQGLIISPDSERFIPILDLETEWKAIDVIWLKVKAI